jgi:hypothetical protein
MRDFWVGTSQTDGGFKHLFAFEGSAATGGMLPLGRLWPKAALQHALQGRRGT